MYKKVSIDIDGILNYYPKPWVDYLNKTLNTNYNSRIEAKQKLDSKKYSEVKDKYRNSKTKANLPVNNENVNFVNRLNELGFEINISTSRPISKSKYPNLFNLTYDWLKNNNIAFDRLLFKEDSDNFFSKIGAIDFHIDDDIKYALMFANKGIKTFYFNQYEKLTIKHELIIELENLNDIIDESLF